MDTELIVEILIRLDAIEKCLFDKGIVDKDEYYKKMNEITKEITDKLLNNNQDK